MLKSIILSLLLVTPVYAAKVEPEIYPHNLIRVVDGDTVEVEAPFLPNPLKKSLFIRILGIDTPEKAPMAKCVQEAELSAKATQNFKILVANAKEIQLKIQEWDKYGGRVLGYVYIDGRSITDIQVEQGLARPYFGEKKSSWCN